jgi:hypothetical protein
VGFLIDFFLVKIALDMSSVGEVGQIRAASSDGHEETG